MVRKTETELSAVEVMQLIMGKVRPAAAAAMKEPVEIAIFMENGIVYDASEVSFIQVSYEEEL